MSTRENKLVLVVDDVEVNFLVIKHLMEARGFVLKFAHDRDSAFQQCKAYKFDAILMDISIPEVDGFKIYKELQDLDLITCTTQVIAYTVHGTEKERLALYDAGFEAVFTKPFDSDSADRLTTLLNQ